MVQRRCGVALPAQDHQVIGVGDEANAKAFLKAELATLTKLWKDEGGATAIEYGLIAALIAVAAISAMQLVGTHLASTFNTIGSKL